MATLPRMRNAEGVLKELKAQDPDTVITLNFIRALIRSGKSLLSRLGATSW